MKEMKLLQDRWAVVTGSSRGVRQQIALGLAERQCNVVVHGRRLENLAQTQQMLQGSGVQVCAVAGDIGTPEGRAALARGVQEGPGRVDILYNNAAIMSQWKDLWQVTLEEWLEIFSVNLFAMIELCRAFVPGMVERGYGRVINLTFGIEDVPHLAPYNVQGGGGQIHARPGRPFERDERAGKLPGPGLAKTDLGGPNADHEVETVLPGALVPALLDDNGPSGRIYAAQDFKCLG
jgi:3-oxoacyl-[acyl-carrier protein] reductase